MPPTADDQRTSNGDAGAVASTAPADNATHTADRSPTAAPTAAPTAPAHRASDRYDILGEHGRGGLGRVSRAHDRELDRDVAIKELLNRTHVSEVRFFREALITARLEHPGIVPVHEAGRWPDGTPFYAMKLVAGRPLRDLLSERNTVAERLELLHHVIAVADAIAYAHGRNIIHRDLKPANVVVGDFGETIVIDWGLAKDLSTTDEPPLAGSSLVSSGSDLTSTGSVLGTPAYMAPEQARGERVDQRADVFAIGAMLWELCSLQKVPPTNRRDRHRLLRRSGIDHDLITIIDKALDDNPTGRYHDAAALATDLKAFKAGARIAARHYSLVEALAHWARRNRALTTAIALLVLSIIAGTVIYLRAVSTERHRTDAALAHLASAKSNLDKEHADLVLKHAELLLTRDPADTISSLEGYQGSDKLQMTLLATEARGRGASSYRATPHSDNVTWATALATGDIVTMSIDGTIARSSKDGVVETLRDDAPRWPVFSYAASNHLLTYACHTYKICEYDIQLRAHSSIDGSPSKRRITGIAVSADATLIATITEDGSFHLFDNRSRTHEQLFEIPAKNATSLVFVSRDEIAVSGTTDDLDIVSVSQKKVTWRTHIAHGSLWDTDAANHRLTVATTEGDINVLDLRGRSFTQHVKACDGFVTGLLFIPTTDLLAYACNQGTVGTISIRDGSKRVRAQLDTPIGVIAISPQGDYILAGMANSVLAFIDLKTQSLKFYRGSHSRITSIVPMSPNFPFIVTGEARGEVRTWRPPDRTASVVAHADTRLFGLTLRRKEHTVIATTYTPALLSINTQGVELLKPHAPEAMNIAVSSDENVMVLYGATDLIEVWTFAPSATSRTIRTNLGAVRARV